MPDRPALGDAACNKSVTTGQGLLLGTRSREISALVGRARHHFLDLDGDAVAAHHDGAPRHRKVIDEDFHLIFFRRIKLDDGAAAEPQRLVNGHRGRAKHYGDVERNLVERRHWSQFLKLTGPNGPPGQVTMVWLADG